MKRECEAWQKIIGSINLTNESQLGSTTVCFNVHGNNYESHFT
ncbi:hypothetical protein T12_16291 [Trichinella patagoniensis]|uniref:Uncharacterized protein n=1 Tax=Trichinella patagoniensis TaxID=990121 RepID=A0A0V0YQG1_9BILA|nr:hypothetical protein T12_16291 [Trichinella patagoniensis]